LRTGIPKQIDYFATIDPEVSRKALSQKFADRVLTFIAFRLRMFECVTF
jgi:hypothetical protein